jgi:hypothetical protein
MGGGEGCGGGGGAGSGGGVLDASGWPPKRSVLAHALSAASVSKMAAAFAPLVRQFSIRIAPIIFANRLAIVTAWSE